MTGTIDYLSDGERVIAIENGHELLGQVTGVSPSPSSPHYQTINTNQTLPDRLRNRLHLRLLPSNLPFRQTSRRPLWPPDVRNRIRECRG